MGRGGFGEAHLVLSSNTRELLVNKVVDMTDMTYEERCHARDEAKFLEVLNHPNIIRFHEVFRTTREIGGIRRMYLNILMEYADDGELATKI